MNRKIFSIAAVIAGRTLSSRFKGSKIGLGWLFLNPLAQMTMFVVVFGYVLNVRWVTQAGSTQTEQHKAISIAIGIAMGLAVFNFITESMIRASTLFADNKQLISKVVTPQRSLTLSVTLGSTVNFGAMLFIVMFLSAYMGRLSIAILPTLALLIAALFCTVQGLTEITAYIGAYIKDLATQLAVIFGALIFLSPVFYPIELIPESFRFAFALNPVVPFIDAFRSIVLQGRAPSANSLTYVFVIASLVLSVGAIGREIFEEKIADVI